MKKIALGALFAGLLAACGGSKSNNTPDLLVVNTPDAPVSTTCNLFTQTGCGTGEKCTWIRIAASSTQQLGKIGCVSSANANVAVGGACAWGPAGDTTGFDNCVGGAVCLASSEKDSATGHCEQICDFAQVPGSGAAGACGNNFACGNWTNFFQNPGDTSASAGLCDPTCDPLTQKLDTDGSANCGGGKDSNGDPVLGCYGGWFGTQDFPSQFTCSDVLHPTNTADVIAYDTTRGTYYLNSCAPGYQPLYYTDSQHRDAMHVTCTAFCAPAPTSKEAHPNPGGVATAADYLGGTCTAAGHIAGTECRYWWQDEADPTTGATAMMSKWSNGLGSCEEWQHFTYDATQFFKNGANNPYLNPPAPATTTDPIPSCVVLSSTAFNFDTTVSDGVNDAMFWGCQPEPTAFVNGKKPHWKMPQLHLAAQSAHTAN